MAIGTARGSVGGSRVAYVTDIIDLNPETWHTVFSRFANESRREIGDIDIDCVESDRPAIFEHITAQFGKDKTARVASFGTMQAKGVMDDVGRALAMKWSEEHTMERPEDNPWSLKQIAKIKQEFDADPEKTKSKYPELFYYYDGLIDTKISQSVHPAGMVISPITLPDNFGVFDKDGDVCLMLDMDNIHDYTGLAKYDFLILKTVQVIRDTCNYLNIPYPRTCDIDWDDQEVWEGMRKDPSGIFQFEGKFAFECFKKFKPKSIFDMSIVTACIRPSGASYRDDLLARKPHKNPSELIDNLLKDNLGYLCIEGTQKVDTSDGMKEIKDVKAGDYVKTRSGYKEVLDSRKTGHKDVVSVNYLGTNIICTKDHKLLTDHGWKEAGSLTTEDHVAFRTGGYVGKEYSLDMSKIIGWLIGDGTITSRRGIKIDNRSVYVANEFKKSVEREFPDLEVNTSVLKVCKNGENLYRSSVKYRKCSKEMNPLSKELSRCGIIGKNSKTKFVPSVIMNGTEDVVKSFLGAYTDTDSMVKFNNNTAQCVYTTASKRLASDLQNLIRMTGYMSNIYFEENKYGGAYHIVVNNASDYIKDLIGYSTKISGLKDEVIRHNDERNRVFGSCINIDVVNKWLFENGIVRKRVFKELGIMLYGKKKSISIFSARKIVKKYNLSVPDEFMNNNILWASVSSVIQKGDADVYDITVSDEHEFVCQGIIAHNCYQEDTIKFLQQICGLSGSESDNIRRAIGRKQKDRLDKALPSILDGYCNKSDKPREQAEEEAKEFLQILEDSASYQFGYNHSIAYCLLGYMCGYLRHYHPLEFVTSFLNNAANEDDIRNGTTFANKVGIKVTMPKWGISRSDYAFDCDKNVISKGLSSVKYMSAKVADELYHLAHKKAYKYFVDILNDIDNETSVDSRQLDILIKLDFFSDYGNQRELLRIAEMFDGMFKRGEAKKISKSRVDGTPLEPIVKKYSVGVTKSGGEAKSYTLLDIMSILYEVEDAIKEVHMEDLSDLTKVRNFSEAMGYAGYVSGKQEDRRKLYITDVYPVVRRRDNKQFGYSILTKSIGSGKESRFTVLNKVYEKDPIKKDDIIYCKSFEFDRGYFRLLDFYKIY